MIGIQTNETRRVQYESNVKKTLRKIGLRTLKNVIDLINHYRRGYDQEGYITTIP